MATTTEDRADITDTTAWTHAKDAARILGINIATLPSVVRANGIRTKSMPGLSRTYYLRADLARVAREAIRPRPAATATRATQTKAAGSSAKAKARPPR